MTKTEKYIYVVQQSNKQQGKTAIRFKRLGAMRQRLAKSKTMKATERSKPQKPETVSGGA